MRAWWASVQSKFGWRLDVVGEYSKYQRADNVKLVRRWWGEYRNDPAMSVEAMTQLIQEALADAAKAGPAADSPPRRR